MLARPIIRQLFRTPPSAYDALAAKMKMLVEAYPRWHEASDTACPAKLGTLLPFAIPKLRADHRWLIRVPDETDLWQRPLIMIWGQNPRHGIPAGQPFGLISTGPDLRLGTDDDIRSWELE